MKANVSYEEGRLVYVETTNLPLAPSSPKKSNGIAVVSEDRASFESWLKLEKGIDGTITPVDHSQYTGAGAFFPAIVFFFAGILGTILLDLFSERVLTFAASGAERA